MARKFGKKNEVKCDPLAYNICLLGEPKIGKTTIVKETVEKLAGEDGYIFLEMAGEEGHAAIHDIVYEECDEWCDVLDIVEDIEDNKTTDYKDLKAIVIDTYDGWIKLAQDEAIRLWNKEHPDKRADTIDASWNGFQKGQGKAFDLMFDIIVRLRKVKVAVIIIGHVKNREVSDIATGTQYQTLTSDVEKVYFNLLKKKMHFLGLAYYDRKIITEKTGKKNIVTKKEETVNKVAYESRKIKFRDDNMALDSGSRFAEIIDEIDFNSDNFIKAMKDAITAEISKGNKSFEELQAKQENEESLKDVALAAEEESRKSQKELKSVIDEITTFVKNNKTDMDLIRPVLVKCKEFGVKNPTELTSLEDALAVLKVIQ